MPCHVPHFCLTRPSKLLLTRPPDLCFTSPTDSCALWQQALDPMAKAGSSAWGRRDQATIQFRAGQQHVGEAHNSGSHGNLSWHLGSKAEPSS